MKRNVFRSLTFGLKWTKYTEQKPCLFTRKQISKRFQVYEFKKVHLPCHFFVQTEFDNSTYTWKWKDGQA